MLVVIKVNHLKLVINVFS